jgi:type I restriction enzyme S subunit
VARIEAVEPVKLLVALLWAGVQSRDMALEQLELKWGTIDFSGADHPFDVTDYYEKEMGPSLRRHLVSFSRMIPPESLPEVKLACNRIEERLARQGRRRVNLDAGYLRYCLVTPEMQTLLLSWAGSGGTRNALTKGMIESLEIPLPALSEQRAIAHVLGTLDDKIELNRRMNETLEAMARALFKSWFVDFEPVRAKMEGHWRRGQSLPGLPAEHYDLFPDCLVDSELGEIPEGWGVKPLSDCIDLVRGLSYKGSGLASTGIPMHNLNSIYEGGGYKEDGIKYYNGNFQDRHVTQPGDVLVANTEQGHDRLLIGFAAIVPRHLGGEGLFSHHLYRIQPNRSSALSADYVYRLLNTRSMHGIVSGYATGTTVNMLPVDALRIPSIAVPPNRLVTTFSRVDEAVRERQYSLLTECQNLAAQRDGLLPRLVSGELAMGTE